MDKISLARSTLFWVILILHFYWQVFSKRSPMSFTPSPPCGTNININNLVFVFQKILSIFLTYNFIHFRLIFQDCRYFDFFRLLNTKKYVNKPFYKPVKIVKSKSCSNKNKIISNYHTVNK